jgi:hypothetical protein
MKEEILSNLDNPAQLEKLYRADKSTYKRAFNELYPELKENGLVSFWNERLNFAKEEISWGTGKDLFFVIVASILAGVIAKLPALLGINEEYFYNRNIGFIVFPALSAFFAWKNKLSTGKIATIAGVTIAGLVFINSLPDMKASDTLMLSCIHMVLVLWSVLGFAFAGGAGDTGEKRLGYLRYNGDLVVMTTLILIAGGILTGVTIGLFHLIGFNIEKFYFKWVAIFGLAAAPIVGTYLTQANPQLVGKVSPVIAKIFSPLVLVMLVIYLVAIIYSGKDPYNDREFLLIFNALLVGVMAIIFFSVAETANTNKNRAEPWVLFGLSIVTIIVNCIALSAIVFRIAEGGVTPNRAAVLGSNVLILVNLLLVTAQLYKVISKKADITGVGKVIASYLPFYVVWAAIVTFLFPFLFGFK